VRALNLKSAELTPLPTEADAIAAANLLTEMQERLRPMTRRILDPKSS